MKFTTTAAALIAFALGLTIAGCGGATTSSNTNSANAGNKTATTASPAGSPAAAPAAKQGTPPKADLTMSVEDLHKDYKALFAKDPKSVGDKYENKNIQITGKVSRSYPVTTGSGVETNVMLKGPNSTEDDGACIFTPQTEESMALKVGDTVTLLGTQTHNSNGDTPRLEKCFVIKAGQ